MIIEAKGAKVPKLDVRKGRRATRQYRPPKCPETARLMAAEFEQLDPESAWTDGEEES